MAYFMAAIRAVPRPSLPGRCSTRTRGSAAANSSATRPVPSGELSSMTRTSAAGSCSWTARTSGARLSRSLYVARLTRMRGGDDTAAPDVEVAACSTRGGAPILRLCPTPDTGRGNPHPWTAARAPPMADTVTVVCPECDSKMKVAEEKLGRKVRCKECDETFVAEEATDTVTVVCPECDSKMKVAEEKLGRKVRCKECDETFVAEEATDTVTVVCPECDSKMKVAEEKLGRKVRCKECDETFVAKASGKKKAPAKSAPKPAKPAAKPAATDITAAPKPEAPKPPAGAEGEEDSSAYGLTEERLGKRCPHCAGEMEEEDIICLECGYNLETREHGKTRKVKDVTSQDAFMWLLPGILAAAGCLFMVSWAVSNFIFHYTRTPDYWKARSSDYPKFYENLSLCCVIWFNMFLFFGAWKAGKFAYKRLVENPKPPEREIE